MKTEQTEWNAAITVAINTCVRISDDYNNDDFVQEASGANDCAKEIGKLLNQRDEFMRPPSPEPVDTEAVEFAEWMGNKYFEHITDNIWADKSPEATSYKTITTEQIYNLFKQR